MIFIITHKEDFTADYIVDKLNAASIEYHRFNCEDIQSNGYEFQIGEKTTTLISKISKIDSVWFRRTKLPNLNIDTLSEAERHHLLSEYDALLSNIYHLIDARRWMSIPNNVYLAENKLLQLKMATQLGFETPETLVTSDKNSLKSFAIKHDHDLIIKPLDQGRINDANGIKNIFTNQLKKEHLDNIDEFTLTPSIFQPRIRKEFELRITVIGDKVFVAKVDSQIKEETKVDWRKQKLKFIKYDLPPDISYKCVELVKNLGLSFGAIDMIKSKNGEFVFLEINPNGQWAWIEFDTGLAISDEIINFLNI